MAENLLAFDERRRYVDKARCKMYEAQREDDEGRGDDELVRILVNEVVGQSTKVERALNIARGKRNMARGKRNMARGQRNMARRQGNAVRCLEGFVPGLVQLLVKVLAG